MRIRRFVAGGLFVALLSTAAPAFAKPVRESAEPRDRVIKIIKKLFGVTSLDDSIAPPKP